MSRDRTDEYRRLVRDRSVEAKRNADLQEVHVAQKILKEGCRIVSFGDRVTRTRFSIPGRCADIVAIKTPGVYIVAEVKATDLYKAIDQLENTVPFVRMAESISTIEPRIYVTLPRPKDETTRFSGGFTALGNHATERTLADAKGRPRKLTSGELIKVVFE